MNFKKFAVVVSNNDIAGMNIASFLSDIPIVRVDCDIINAENIDKTNKDAANADFIIFASLHLGKQEKMLSLHAPGNWHKAEFGGKLEKVCKTSGTALKIFFQELNKNVPQGWQTTLECTHHGPYIEKPCLFIEIGSSEKDWKDKEAARAIALTIKNAIKILQNANEIETTIGLGGLHYCNNFNKIQLNSQFAISHIIPEYALPLSEEMLKEAIEKTTEKVSLVLLDWKGLGNSEQRQQVIALLDKIGLKYKRTSEIEK